MKPHADLILTPGKRMQALCEARGISRKELANRLDIAPSQVSRIISLVWNKKSKWKDTFRCG